MNRFHYDGYGSEWCLKSDCNSAWWLCSHGIYGTVKQVRAALPNCACGWIATGGSGHVQHIRVFSLHKLRSLFPKG